MSDCVSTIKPFTKYIDFCFEEIEICAINFKAIYDRHTPLIDYIERNGKCLRVSDDSTGLPGMIAIELEGTKTESVWNMDAEIMDRRIL